MDLIQYISFLEELGQRIIWIDKVPFYEYRPFFYWSLPKFTIKKVDEKKVRRLLLTKALGLLYPNINGKKVIKFCVSHGPVYDIKYLHKKKRNQTRRGLERCEIRQVEWEQMRVEGLSINIEALKRQQRKSGRLSNAKWWDRQCKVSSRYSDVLAWGAFVKGELTGYVHVIIHDNILENWGSERVANIVHFMSNSHHLKCYPNEALIYTVTQELLGSYDCAYAILGSSSDDLQLLSWKRHMGFNAKPFPCSIIVNPILHLGKYVMPKLKTYLNG